MEYVVRKIPGDEHVAGSMLTITHEELLWIEVIRQASADTNPPLTPDHVRRVRAIFRDPSG